MGACLSTDIVQFDGTVVDAALATPELSTLVDAVVAAGLVDALNDAENITVYAPTNDAFAAIPGEVADAILADLRGDGYQVEFPFDKDGEEESVDIRETEWYQELNQNRSGSLLAGYRLRAELTQKQLAKKCGLAQSVISAYERGKRPISRKAALTLAKVLDIDADRLVNR